MTNEIERVAPWFECDDDGYPEDESLERLRAYFKEDEFTPQHAVRFMLADFPAICKGIACCQVDVESWVGEDGLAITDPRNLKDTRKVSFSTGGWSGAESLIAVVLSSLYIDMMHVAWRRGGHYTFEVPAHWLEEKV